MKIFERSDKDLSYVVPDNFYQTTPLNKIKMEKIERS